MQTGFSFSVRAFPGLRLEVEEDGLDGAGRSGIARISRTTVHRFRITGPEDYVENLQKVGGERLLTGKLSPPTRITVSGEAAKKIGIPQGAHEFAFAYPQTLEDGEAAALVKAAVKTTAGSTRSLTATPVWLDFCVTGGFVYFDANGELLQANALGLNPNASKFQIKYDGPHEASSAAGHAMIERARMETVTLESLKAIGFVSFGWLNPAEEPGGFSLTPRRLRSADATHAGGAFLYRQVLGDEDTFYYYALAQAEGGHWRGGPESEGEERRSSVVGPKALSGAALALDNALRGSVVRLRESIKEAHVAAKELIEDHQQIRMMADHVALSEAERRQNLDPRHRWRKLVRSYLLWSLPAVASVGTTAGLLAGSFPLHLVLDGALYLAVYRLFASLLWFSCLTYLTWVVLSSCAIEGLSTAQLRRRRVCLPLIPLCAAATEFGLLLPAALGVSGEWAATLAKAADLGALTVANLLNYVALPLSLFLPRRAAAQKVISDMHNERAGVAAARRAAKLQRTAREEASEGGRRGRRKRRGSRDSNRSLAVPAPPWGNVRGRPPAVMRVISLRPPPFMGPPTHAPNGVMTHPTSTLPEPIGMGTIDESLIVTMSPPPRMGPPDGAPTRAPARASAPRTLTTPVGGAPIGPLEVAPRAIMPPSSILKHKTRHPMRDDETDAAADGDSTPRAARVKGGRKNKPGPAARAAVGVGFAAAAAFVGAAVGGGGDVMAGGGGAEESICGGNGNGGGARGPRVTCDGRTDETDLERRRRQLQGGAPPEGGDGDGDDEQSDARKAWLEAAAVVCQSRQRKKTAQRIFRDTLLKRQYDRCYLSVPILIAALLENVGTFAIQAMETWFPALLPEWLRISGWLLLLLPALVIVLRDVSAPTANRHSFSISHAVFFCSSLYRVSFRAATFSLGITNLYIELLSASGLPDDWAHVLGQVHNLPTHPSFHGPPLTFSLLVSSSPGVAPNVLHRCDHDRQARSPARRHRECLRPPPLPFPRL